ncbi:hypothetical protein [uncultured Arthrobacter sp.]|uniref:hypothetical protein n=1 Tax=uncultured Arthrobacter sp. TaxID=114050 RepID=UPI002607298E|nr:hypothetical protein [uncultured Arthrobacter sp.]
MKAEVKHFIAGGVLLLLSTLFVPQGISGFSRSAARGESVDQGSVVLLIIGAVIVVIAIALLARGHVLRYRTRARAARRGQEG